MSKFILTSFLFGIIIFFISCETDFDTTADWEDITVVYGIIDQNDSVHYIKINKAFLTENNTLTYAQEYDSINYPFPMRVWIEERDENDQLIQTFEFDTTTTYKPDDPDAVFHTGAQRIYKTVLDNFYEIKYEIQPPFDTVGWRKVWLNDESTYNLFVEYPDSSKLITSETELVQDFAFTRPFPGSQFVRFVTNPVLPSEISWNRAPNDEGTFKYQLRVIFNYQELTFDNVLTNHSIDLIADVVVYPTIGDSEYTYYYWDNNFYNSCESNIPYDDPDKEATIKERYTVDVEYFVSVAGSNLNLFMQVYEPSTSIVQEKPPYTNVENGIGVYSSRYKVTTSKLLHQESVQDLIAIDDNVMKFVY